MANESLGEKVLHGIETVLKDGTTIAGIIDPELQALGGIFAPGTAAGAVVAKASQIVDDFTNINALVQTATAAGGGGTPLAALVGNAVLASEVFAGKHITDQGLFNQSASQLTEAIAGFQKSIG